MEAKKRKRLILWCGGLAAIAAAVVCVIFYLVKGSVGSVSAVPITKEYSFQLPFAVSGWASVLVAPLLVGAVVWLVTISRPQNMSEKDWKFFDIFGTAAGLLVAVFASVVGGITAGIIGGVNAGIFSGLVAGITAGIVIVIMTKIAADLQPNLFTVAFLIITAAAAISVMTSIAASLGTGFITGMFPSIAAGIAVGIGIALFTVVAVSVIAAICWMIKSK